MITDDEANKTARPKFDPLPNQFNNLHRASLTYTPKTNNKLNKNNNDSISELNQDSNSFETTVVVKNQYWQTEEEEIKVKTQEEKMEVFYIKVFVITSSAAIIMFMFLQGIMLSSLPRI